MAAKAGKAGPGEERVGKGAFNRAGSYGYRCKKRHFSLHIATQPRGLAALLAAALPNTHRPSSGRIEEEPCCMRAEDWISRRLGTKDMLLQLRPVLQNCVLAQRYPAFLPAEQTASCTNSPQARTLSSSIIRHFLKASGHWICQVSFCKTPCSNCCRCCQACNWRGICEDLHKNKVIPPERNHATEGSFLEGLQTSPTH